MPSPSRSCADECGLIHVDGVPPALNLTGLRFGRLTVLSRVAASDCGKAQWLCRCDCGASLTVPSGSLKSGNSKSCGCLQRDTAKERALDLTGQRFGRLVALRRAPFAPGVANWQMRCDCGADVVVVTASLRAGKTVSCGCKQSEGRTPVHGGSVDGVVTAEYSTLHGMRKRCLNPRDSSYKNYGGRGITVCARWRGRDGYKNFIADMGPRPSPLHSIDRYPDNDGNYEPGNCRWATPSEQARNTRQNRTIEFHGESACLTEWAEQLGMHPRALARRLDAGWSVDRAISTPIRQVQ